MSKLPRISGNIMIKYLIKKGFVIINRTGSHVILEKDHVYTTVPVGNRTMKIGLQLGVLRDTMIDKNEFIADHAKKTIR